MGRVLDQCLMNCDYVTKWKEPVIHAFGRSPRNMFMRLHTEIHGFEPFFYVGDGVEISAGAIKNFGVDPRYPLSLDDQPVKRITTFVPGDVSDLRNNYLSGIRTYQSKVLFPTNFMCCTGIKGGFSFSLDDAVSPENRDPFSPDYIVYDYNKLVPSNDVYVSPLSLILDIETNNSDGNPSLWKPDQEITMTTFKDTYSRWQYTFAWHPKWPIREVRDLVYHYDYSNIDMKWKLLLFNDEFDMLDLMSKFISKASPDVYTGWNVNFDMVYLIGRMRAMGIEPSFFSPLGKVSIRQIKDEKTGEVKALVPVVKGATVLDMLSGYKGITRFEGMKPSYKLDDVGSDELGMGKVHFAGRVGNLWKNDFKKCIQYNVRDVEICWEVDKKISVIDYHDIVRRQSGCKFEDSVYTSRIIETEVLRKAMSIGRVVPTVVEKKRKGKFEGAYVFAPVIGKHFSVLMIDLKSLYPSIIMTLNISPQTRIDPSQYTEEELSQFIRSAAGSYYRKDIVGFAKDCLMDMNKHRDMFKSCVLLMSDIIKQEDKIFANGIEGIVDGIASVISENRFNLSREVIEFVSTRLKVISFSGKTKEQILKILESEESKYDLMQKAEKAKINTWYGIMGKEGSSLSNVHDAESVTITGGEIIRFSAKVAESDEMSTALKENFGIDVRLKVLYGDSITGNRCIAVKIGDMIDVMPIEDVWNAVVGSIMTRDGKEVKVPVDLYTIGKKGTWERVNEIIRHKTQKRIYRIRQKNGETECTEDHSLITEGYVRTTPMDLGNKKIMYLRCLDVGKKSIDGDVIDLYPLLKNFKLVMTGKKGKRREYTWHNEQETLWFGWHRTIQTRSIRRFVRTEILCSLLGIFVAEGHVSYRDKTGFCMGISNADLSIITEVKKMMDEVNHDAIVSVIVSEDRMRTVQKWTYYSKCYRVQSNNLTWSALFYALCGKGAGGKKVPAFVFNVKRTYQKKFYEYYFKGDGSKYNNNGSSTCGITTKSLRLVSGLSFLLKSWGRDVSIYVDKRNGVYRMTERIVGSQDFKHPIETMMTETGGCGEMYVYDLSVDESHVFADACGMLLLHNTDSAFISGLESVTDFTMMTMIAEFVGKFITKAYDAFCKERYNVDVHYLKIRCEEIARVFCMSPRKGKPERGGKKRYWYWLWGEFKGEKGWIENTKKEIEIVGFEAKRSNVAKIGRDVQRKVMEYITFDKHPSYVRSYLDFIHKKLVSGEYDIDDITFNTTLDDFSAYDAVKKNQPVSSWDEHVRAAYWGIHRFGQNWKPGDKIKVVYTSKSPRKYSRMDVIAVEGTGPPAGFEIDYEKIYEKQVRDRLVSVLATVGWTYNSVMSGMQSTTL